MKHIRMVVIGLVNVIMFGLVGAQESGGEVVQRANLNDMTEQ